MKEAHQIILEQIEALLIVVRPATLTLTWIVAHSRQPANSNGARGAVTV